MFIANTIIVICWILFILYWGINWSFVKPTQEPSWSSPANSRLIIFGLIIAFLLVSRFHGFLLTLSERALTLHYLFLQPIGAIVTIIGLIIAIIARKTLADNWSSNIEFKKGHELITNGVYRYMRHPIYTGILLMGLGSLLVLQSISVVVFFIGMIAFFYYKMQKEELLMSKHFPNEYVAYKKRTKALIPFIF